MAKDVNINSIVLVSSASLSSMSRCTVPSPLIQTESISFRKLLTTRSVDYLKEPGQDF